MQLQKLEMVASTFITDPRTMEVDGLESFLCNLLRI